MRASELEVVAEEAGEIGGRVEDLGLLGVHFEELLHIEDLNIVVHAFGADDEVVAAHFDFSPDDGASLGRQSSKIDELALACNFGERSAIGLSNGNELAAAVAPTPGA